MDTKDQKQQIRNVVLAAVISIAIIVGFQHFGPKPTTTPHPQPGTETSQPVPVPAANALEVVPRPLVLARSPRVQIETPRLDGSINLVGARLDDLRLKDYHETVDPRSPEIVLLSPDGAKSLSEGAAPAGATPEDVEKAAQDPYFIDFGWTAPSDPKLKLPTPETKWTASGQQLSPQQPLDLTWDNGEGLHFAYHFAVDDNYMFTVTASVENDTDQPVTLVPTGRMTRDGNPVTVSTWLLHEGPIGALGGSIKEATYAALRPAKSETYTSTGGWFGITDKYWLAAFIPDQQEAVTARFSSTGPDKAEVFFADYTGTERAIPPHGRTTSDEDLFAGAKEVHLLDDYEKALKIPLFDRAIDFGWFYWITKPFLLTLDYFSKHIFADFKGSFGFAILLLTLLVKLLFFPLANKSYRAMSKMKALQPKMQELRERFGEDRARLNQEMMALYKAAGANPMAGCLPIFVQIPVFFSLYKVLYVNIEMWHAPFYGWIHDLSARDPTSIFNLFGLLPFTVPEHLGPIPLIIGVWPLIMGVTMFLQQKLNPPPPDPVQAKMFMFLPVIFTFMMSQFAAGLVIYWTWNNLLTIAQQWTIMRRARVSPRG
ncbi:MAG TPA: membrane protein insertase YidC [Stellaceae bacterium]|nr:membrane protein insertase YidC [Stellaceae bacterium]